MKRFFKILGICFGGMIGLIAIVIAVVAIQGGFNPEKKGVSALSFSSDMSSVTAVTIVDDYTATIYYTPEDANQKKVSLRVNHEGADVVEIPTTVTAGEPFVIKVKKHTVNIDGRDVSLNVGGEAEIIAIDEAKMFSCRLLITVDKELVDGALDIISPKTAFTGATGDEVSFYTLNRLGSGTFQVSVQTTPENALAPNSGQVPGANQIGYKDVELTIPEGFMLVGDVLKKDSFYSASTREYFDYSLFYQSVKYNDMDGLYIDKDNQRYSNLVRIRHYIYTIKLAEDVGSNFEVHARAFKTHEMQEDFKQLKNEHWEADHVNYELFSSFVSKYSQYIAKVSRAYQNYDRETGTQKYETGQQFLTRIRGAILNIDDYEAAFQYLYVVETQLFKVKEIEVDEVTIDLSEISFNLFSNTFENNGAIYNLDSLTKADLIDMLGVSLKVIGSGEQITSFVGELEMFSLKLPQGEFDEWAMESGEAWDSIFDTRDALRKRYDNNDIVSIEFDRSTREYSINVLSGENMDDSYIHLRILKNPSGKTYAERYLSINIWISNVEYTIANKLSLNTLEDLFTNRNNSTLKNIQTLSVVYSTAGAAATNSATAVIDKGNSPSLTYSNVSFFVMKDNLFLSSGDPKIAIGNKIYFTKHTDATNVSDLPEFAYELPKDSSGNYYMQALNNTGEHQIKVFAVIQLTDKQGERVLKDNKIVVVNKSNSENLKINTVAEDLYYYTITKVDGKKVFYNRNAVDGNSVTGQLELLLSNEYDLYVSTLHLDKAGNIIIPTNVSDNVNYLYNVLYAQKSFMEQAQESDFVLKRNGQIEIEDILTTQKQLAALSHEDISKYTKTFLSVNTVDEMIRYLNSFRKLIPIGDGVDIEYDKIKEVLSDKNIVNLETFPNLASIHNYLQENYSFINASKKALAEESFYSTDVITLVDLLSRYFAVDVAGSNSFSAVKSQIKLKDLADDLLSTLTITVNTTSSDEGGPLYLNKLEEIARYINLRKTQEELGISATAEISATSYSGLLSTVFTNITTKYLKWDKINDASDIYDAIDIINLNKIIGVIKDVYGQEGLIQFITQESDIRSFSKTVNTIITFLKDRTSNKEIYAALTSISTIDEIMDLMGIKQYKVNATKVAITKEIQTRQVLKFLRDVVSLQTTFVGESAPRTAKTIDEAITVIEEKIFTKFSPKQAVRFLNDVYGISKTESDSVSFIDVEELVNSIALVEYINGNSDIPAILSLSSDYPDIVTILNSYLSVAEQVTSLEDALQYYSELVVISSQNESGQDKSTNDIIEEMLRDIGEEEEYIYGDIALTDLEKINMFQLAYYLGISDEIDISMERIREIILSDMQNFTLIKSKLQTVNPSFNGTTLADFITERNTQQVKNYLNATLGANITGNSLDTIIDYMRTRSSSYNDLLTSADNRNIFTIISLLNPYSDENIFAFLPKDASVNKVIEFLDLELESNVVISLTHNVAVTSGSQNILSKIPGLKIGDVLVIQEFYEATFDKDGNELDYILYTGQPAINIYPKTGESITSWNVTIERVLGFTSIIDYINSREGRVVVDYLETTQQLLNFDKQYNLSLKIGSAIDSARQITSAPTVQDLIKYINKEIARATYENYYGNVSGDTFEFLIAELKGEETPADNNYYLPLKVNTHKVTGPNQYWFINSKSDLASNYVKVGVHAIGIDDAQISLQGTEKESDGKIISHAGAAKVMLNLDEDTFKWLLQKEGSSLGQVSFKEITTDFDIKKLFTSEDEETKFYTSPKIDAAYNSDDYVTDYIDKIKSFISGNTEGKYTWSSSRPDIAEIVIEEGNPVLKIKKGSISGEEVVLSCLLQIYSVGDEFLVEKTATFILTVQQDDLQVRLYSKAEGTTSAEWGSTEIEGAHVYRENTQDNPQSVEIGKTFNLFGEGVLGYVVKLDANVNKINQDMNIFDELYRKAGYSLEEGDYLHITGYYEGSTEYSDVANKIEFSSTSENKQLKVITSQDLQNKNISIKFVESDGYDKNYWLKITVYKRNINIAEKVKQGEYIGIGLDIYDSLNNAYTAGDEMAESHELRITNGDFVFGNYKTKVNINDVVSNKEIYIYPTKETSVLSQLEIQIWEGSTLKGTITGTTNSYIKYGTFANGSIFTRVTADNKTYNNLKINIINPYTTENISFMRFKREESLNNLLSDESLGYTLSIPGSNAYLKNEETSNVIEQGVSVDISTEEDLSKYVVIRKDTSTYESIILKIERGGEETNIPVYLNEIKNNPRIMIQSNGEGIFILKEYRINKFISVMYSGEDLLSDFLSGTINLEENRLTIGALTFTLSDQLSWTETGSITVVDDIPDSNIATVTVNIAGLEVSYTYYFRIELRPDKVSYSATNVKDSVDEVNKNTTTNKKEVNVGTLLNLMDYISLGYTHGETTQNIPNEYISASLTNATSGTYFVIPATTGVGVDGKSYRIITNTEGEVSLEEITGTIPESYYILVNNASPSTVDDESREMYIYAPSEAEVAVRISVLGIEYFYYIAIVGE